MIPVINLRLFYYSLFALIIIIADQLSKYLVYQYLPLSGSIDITGFLSITHAHNHGIAFSWFSNANQLFDTLLISFSVVAILFLISLIVFSKNTHPWFSWSLILVISGATGNLIDRLYHGFVIDFISISPFPIFNLADIFISVGVIGYVFFDYIYNKNLKKG